MRRLLFCAAVVLSAVAAPAADPKPWSAAGDAKQLQGKWRLKSAWQGGSSGTADGHPALVKALKAEKGVIRFEKDALLVEAGGLTATFQNDLDLPEKQKAVESAVRGQRLVKLTPAGEKPLYASYEVSKDGLSVRYPAGACSRSGLVLTFERAE